MKIKSTSRYIASLSVFSTAFALSMLTSFTMPSTVLAQAKKEAGQYCLVDGDTKPEVKCKKGEVMFIYPRRHQDFLIAEHCDFNLQIVRADSDKMDARIYNVICVKR